MGLIKAAAGAIGSTLGDQWEDFLKADALDNDTLVQKVTTKSGAITKKSRIEVAPGQIAIIFDSGKILDVTAEEGIYSFDESTSPSLFAGQFGDVFKEMWQRFTYNGATAKEQAVYYINVKENIGNKFGSSNAMAYDDPEYRTIYIRYFGEYTFKITEPATFFRNIVGNISDKYTKEELMEQANGEFVQALDAALNKCAIDGIKFSRLPSEQVKIADYMNEALNEKWNSMRGMSVASVAIEKITPDDASRERIEKFDNAAMFGKQEYAAGRMVDATANAMEGAANNANGAAAGFMGLGMMNMAAGNMNGGQSPVSYIQQNGQAQAQEPTQAAGAKFCSQCGAPLNGGNFCSQCGAKVQ
ncbi:MAG: SPFH domain-containing protein [Clostridia bacterium]|nr:SPFH domain-containing protein [Clostridia bacterium]